MAGGFFYMLNCHFYKRKPEFLAKPVLLSVKPCRGIILEYLCRPIKI